MVIKKYSIALSAFALCLSLLAAFYPGPSFANEYERGERGVGGEGREERGERKREGDSSGFPQNALYSEECSSCHFLYHPGLLPERSWDGIIKNSDKHFGENLALDEKTKVELRAYLKEHSAERWRSKWSRKILKSVGTAVPERITEIPYMKRKHREIKKGVFERPSIKSFSNCGACHTIGHKGDFEEDNVKIPKE